MTPQDAAAWAGLTSMGDPRWSFGLAMINGEWWLIGCRGDLSFPMYAIASVSNPDKAFHAWLDGPQWRMVEWLCSEPERKFREAQERLESFMGPMNSLNVYK